VFSQSDALNLIPYSLCISSILSTYTNLIPKSLIPSLALE
jgi:hypothetical protein